MEIFDIIPGFDDRFFVYWEDADLSMQLKKKGLRVVTDTSLVCRHKVSSSTGGQFSRFTVYHGVRGHMLFVRKHYGTVALAYVVPMATAKMLLNVMLGRMRSQEIKPWLNGLISGLRG